MAGWSTHQGHAVGLPLDNIDTDQLIPARFMSTPRSEGYGSYLLHDMRHDAEGRPRADLALNAHPKASVLIARRNFGCGSSREAAVYALVDAGFRAVIAPSFGDIFAGNAVNNGLLPAQLAENEVEALLAKLAAGKARCEIDLHEGHVTLAGQKFPFTLDETWRTKLINGWDDIDLTRADHAAIDIFGQTRPAWTRPAPESD